MGKLFLSHPLVGGTSFQIDRDIGLALQAGDELTKQRWESVLDVSGSPLELHWSRDTRGMIGAMPLIGMIIVATWCMAPRTKRGLG